MDGIRLDGASLAQREEAMECLGKALRLPEWWGRNLDALHDCLSEVRGRLVLEHPERLQETPFGRRLLRVLEDAARENPGLALDIYFGEWPEEIDR